MNTRLQGSIMAAVLLVAGTAFSAYYFAFVAPGKSALTRADEIVVAHGRSAQVGCQEAARMFYDVKWAAACMAHAGPSPANPNDGHAECDLPDDKAAVLNAWLNEAEKRCGLDMRASSR